MIMFDIYGEDLSKPRSPRVSPLTAEEQGQIDIMNCEIRRLEAEIHGVEYAKERITHWEPRRGK